MALLLGGMGRTGAVGSLSSEGAWTGSEETLEAQAVEQTSPTEAAYASYRAAHAW